MLARQGIQLKLVVTPVDNDRKPTKSLLVNEASRAASSVIRSTPLGNSTWSSPPAVFVGAITAS